MNIFEILNILSISYSLIEHEAVYTVAQAHALLNRSIGAECKNLFLTDKNRFFLVLLSSEKQANMKSIAAFLGCKSLRFASPEMLLSVLGLTPGSVGPFGIINDRENQVTLLIDSDLEGKTIMFHPNDNTKTISITYEDLIRFIEYVGHAFFVLPGDQFQKTAKKEKGQTDV